ncbi:MAG: uncharacterized protein JWQ04_2384, partial [Pedosphaera sp.]|nr:uncharacterized protein [Pedosphaera sp.]
MTETEYLEIERRAEFKSEFRDGEIIPMSAVNRWQSLIAVNLCAELGKHLRGRTCTVYNSQLRVKVEAAEFYTYPDLSIASDDQQFEAAYDDDTLLTPAVIVEILSDSREAYDRGKKFELYRQIPSLREYLLVSQHKPLVEQFIRQESG